MMKSNIFPIIRFCGFKESWEQCKLGEVTEISSGQNVPNEDGGKYCNLTMGSVNTNGHLVCSLRTNRSDRILAKGMLIMPTRDVGAGYVIGRTAVINENDRYYAGNCLYCLSTGMNEPYYIHHYMNSESARKSIQIIVAGGSQKQITLPGIKSIEVPVCSIEEQRKIAQLFNDLDKTITLYQHNYDKLTKAKAVMLEALFPQKGSLVPELRFTGFTNVWEQRKLADVLSSYTDPVEIPHTGYERLGIRSHAKGTFHSYVPAGHELQTAQMHKVAADKFIVNITFGWEHAVAVTDENDAGKLVSHRFPQFSLSEELDSKFLKFIILDENFRHHLWLASPGGAGRNRVLNLTEMLQYEIRIPSVSEQRQIADVLIRLDNLITLHRRKYEKLKQIKQTTLQKMFASIASST